MTWRRIPWATMGKSLLLAWLFVLLGLSVFLWYLKTDSFQQLARRRLIAAIESATGGRVEVGSVRTSPLRLRVEVADLTIHGREAAGQEPFAHVDSLTGVINLSSALGAKLAFHSLVLQHPVIHVITYADGSTNQPTPMTRGGTDLERLFSFSARRLVVRQGELRWQDQRIPLDFSSNDVSASLNYSFLRLRYSGILEVGKAETTFDGWRPVAWAAKADFNFDRNGAQINSLAAVAGHSQLRANGVHVDLRKLAASGKYDLNLDLAEASSITRRNQFNSGMLHLQGAGSLSLSGIVSQGNFALRDAGWQGPNFSARDLSAAGEFSIDPQRIQISKIDGQYLHGNFTGDAEVLHWSPAKTAKNQEQQGAINVRASKLSLSELLGALGPKFRAVKSQDFAGNISGSAEVRWKRSIQNANAAVRADISPSARMREGQVPLVAQVSGNYDLRSGEMQFNEFSASTPTSQMHVTGSLANSIRISAASQNPDEWQALIAQFFPNGLPIVVHGRAVFNGTASGSPSNLHLAGNLQLLDFDVIGRSEKGTKRQLHWDSLAADLQASANNLSLRTATLRREDGTVTINGAVGLSSWALYPDSPLRAHVSMHNANAEELGSFAGYDHELTGKLSGEVQLTGTRRQPQGQGNVTLLNPVIRNVPFDSGSSSFALNGNQLAIRELRLERGGAQMTGTGAYDLGSKSFHMNMRGSGFDLAWFAPLERLPVKLAGKMDLTAEASGTASAPEITADLRLRNLSLDGEPQGDFLLSVRSNSDVAHVTGHSEFKNSELQLDGEVRLREQWPSHINLHLLRVDLDPLLAVYARSQAIHNSTASGDVVLDGPLRDPAGLNLSGALNDLEANAGSTNVHNDGPIRFALSGGTLKVDPFKLAGDNATFSGNGFVQLKGERNVDFQGEGKIGLQLLQAYDPDISSSGAVSGELQVTGTLDAPLLRGSVQIQDGAISDINVPSALSDINGKLVLNQNQVTIENLDAHVGGGTISFTGQANLSGKQLNFDVDANAGSVRLRYPPGVSSTANASLHWTGSSSGSVLSGDILVTKLGFTPGFDFGAYLERAAAVSSLPQTDPLLNRIRLDLHLTTTPELQMQTSVIRLQGSADLRVRGSAAKPIMLGRADVFEGEAYFNGTKYRLERGGVTFSNAAVTTPFVDLEAVTRVRDYDVTLSLNGDISRPNGLKVNYRSDPPLPSADIIALLAFGQTTQESAELQQTNQSAFSQQASNAMLAAALNATLSNRAQRLFGNSRIKIDPQGLESETSTTTQYGPAVTIEQQVKSNITLSYTTDVSQTAQQVIRAEYNISKNVSIVAIRDQNGVVSFDVKIRRRKR